MKYQTKNELNFTVPKPFNFLKNDYNEKKLMKIKSILEEREQLENEVFNKKFHANKYNKKMFNEANDTKNIIQREKEQRKLRVDSLKENIISNMKPFSFYDQDFNKFVERKSQQCQPPQFAQFKANKIEWQSQVNMYDG